MKYEYLKVTIKDLTDGTLSLTEDGRFVPFEIQDNPLEFGLMAMHGALNVRPSYQRAFVWSANKQREFIRSLQKGWVINNLVVATNNINEVKKRIANGEPLTADLGLEVVDGQQRICTEVNYVNNGIKDFEDAKFGNLSEGLQAPILNHEMMIQFVQYDDLDEKRQHFMSINQPNVVLTAQELRNAAYCGKFVDSLKKYFSTLGKYACDDAVFSYHGLKDDAVRSQALTETAIIWYLTIHNDAVYDTAEANNGTKGHALIVDEHNSEDVIDEAICTFMKEHINDDAKFVYDEYQNIVRWISKTFDKCKDSNMKKVKNWAYLYRTYKDVDYDYSFLGEQVKELGKDAEIHHKHNIPEYVLFSNRPNCTWIEKYNYSESLLSIANNDTRTAEEVLADVQNNGCADCDIAIEDVNSAVVIKRIPWILGGRATKDNCLVLCKTCASNYKQAIINRLKDMDNNQ